MADGEPIWTEAQRRAIHVVEKSLLVSAAAGSGKTSVLAERCAYLACDARQPCDVDELLVLTFTEDAAATMRTRIHDALVRRQDGSKRAARQLALIEHASISTIDAFCARLLRQHFTEARVDPRFSVIDADEAMLLRAEVARELFDDCYARDANGRFQRFVDAYGDGNDRKLIDVAVQAHSIIGTLENPGQWFRRAVDLVRESAERALRDSELGRRHLTAVKSRLGQIRRDCEAGIAMLGTLGGFAGYSKIINEYRSLIAEWIGLLDRKGLDAVVAQCREFEPIRAPSIAKETPNKEQAKEILDSIKDEIREGKLAQLLTFTEADWRGAQQRTLPMVEVFLKLLGEFAARYATAKARLRGVDFGDLERMTLKLLRDGDGPSEIARECHRRFKHVCVDEYQDVNELQAAILKLLSTECIVTEGYYSPNLFTVGDVKQSIYRFRLAEPQLFLERMAAFRQAGQIGEVIDLQENFRSRAALLDAINKVFERLMTEEAAEIEYSDGHRMNAPARTKFPKEGLSGAPIELHVLPQIRDPDEEGGSENVDAERIEFEAMLCARRIGEMTDAGTQVVGDDGALRLLRYGDVVVLLRSLKHKADDFANVLRRHGIPVHYEGGSGFFEAMEIQDVLALLNILDNQHQDVPLAAYLRSPMAQLGDAVETMARVRMAYPKPTPFYEAAVRYAEKRSDETATELQRIFSQLKQWRERAGQKPLADVIWHVYESTGYLTYVAGLKGGAQRVANLIFLHQRARDFGSFLKQGLHRFMSFITSLSKESDLSLPSISSGQEQVVRIMSIHKAKGLEFPVVIVPDLGKKFNRADLNGPILIDRRGGLGMKAVEVERRIRYPSLSWSLTNATLDRQALAEEMRLLYVAMTRAKEHLILMGTIGEKAVGNWSAKWNGHRGALPTETILSANVALDWLGPAACACGPVVLEMTRHQPTDVLAWPDELTGREKKAEVRREMIEMRPLPAPPVVSDEAKTILSRFEFTYPHQKYVDVGAATSPTALKTFVGDIAIERRELALPAFMSAVRPAVSGSAIGTATHLFLEHLDYSRACDAADAQAQLAEMVKARKLTAGQAEAVDRESIAWFIGSDIGKMIRGNAPRLRRELAFAAAQATESTDPGDAVMLRGRIDLIVPTEKGLVVVDYKTDRIGKEAVGARAGEYKCQMDAYRDALTRAAGEKVAAVYLVFLFPRVVWEEKVA